MRFFHSFILALALAGLSIAQQPAPSATPPAEPAPPSAVEAPTPSPTPTPTPAPQSTRDIINGLSESQLDQAIASLRSNFLDSGRTSEKELRRATLEGLIDRLAPGVSVVTEAGVNATAPAAGFLAEILDGRIGYLRVGAMDAEALSQMDAALESFKANKLHAVILDLRGAPPSTDYEMAANFARRFCPKGKVLFNIQKPAAKQERILTSNQDPAFSEILVVLTDEDTAGSAEALAATLRLNAEAMIVGATTKGEAVEFSDVALGEGKILRVAVAQVSLPEMGAIFPTGVKPDIAAALSPGVQEKIFAASREQGVSQFVFESERPHLNEHALVSGTNPEIEPDDRANGNRDAPLDTVLQRAVDLVTAISFFAGRDR